MTVNERKPPSQRREDKRRRFMIFSVIGTHCGYTPWKRGKHTEREAGGRLPAISVTRFRELLAHVI